MSGGEAMVLALTAIGCGTGIVITFINRVLGGRQKTLQADATAQQERIRLLESQLMEAHRHNDQLQKQLEWHTKMLETQDKLMNRLTDGSRSAESTVGSSR